jgi:hypothetical protein
LAILAGNGYWNREPMNRRRNVNNLEPEIGGTGLWLDEGVVGLYLLQEVYQWAGMGTGAGGGGNEIGKYRG